MTLTQLSRALREGNSDNLTCRRWSVGLSLVGARGNERLASRDAYAGA